MPKTEKQKTGNIGESLAARFLLKQGFSVKQRNYLKKWGEIDIIANKNGVWHFVEVKTVSCGTTVGVPHETRRNGGLSKIWGIFAKILPVSYQYSIIVVTDKDKSSVAHETSSYRPEDNLHVWKLKRLERTIQSYIAEKHINNDDWCIDAITVRLDHSKKMAFIEFLEGIIL